jgi:hypothetical protein
VLAPTELFRPAPVEAFIAVSALEQRAPDGQWLAVPSPPTLPTSDGRSWRLNVPGCSPEVGLTSLTCYAAAVTAPQSVVYGRAVRSGPRLVLQYWYFYAYNFWSPRFPPDEFIWRTHEGDWEHVSIVLSAAQTPLFVGYSQHCTGKRRAWTKVPKSGRTQHPVTFVALGSHGNYFSPGQQPVDLSCWPQAAVLIFRAHRVTALDFTGRGTALGPARPGVERGQLIRVDDGNPPWMRFPGTWGEQGFFHAPDPIGTVSFGAGPAGPGFQGAWKEPLKTMLGWPLG